MILSKNRAVRWSYCYIKYFTNTLANLFENAYSVGAVQGFRPELISPVVSFSRIFVIHQEHLFSGMPECVCDSFFFFTVMCQEELTLFTPLFLQKIRRPVLVSAVKFPVKLLSANMVFVNFSGLKFTPGFQNTKKHCKKMFCKKSCS